MPNWEGRTMLSKKWCMCIRLETVVRDMDTTCFVCGGKDAFGVSKDRPESKKKIVKSV
jgi:hypothetical protein